MNRYKPDVVTHPGETLGDVIREKKLTQTELANKLDMSRSYISDVIRGTRSISVHLAVRLEKLNGFPSAEFWLTRQMHYDLAKARAQ